MKITCYKIKNDVFDEDRTKNVILESSLNSPISIRDDAFLEKLRKNKGDIVEKVQGHISSFNFNRKVFEKSNWNDLSKIARGLFIDTDTNKVIARGFDKFFNYKEGIFNQDNWLKENLVFPVSAYKKYNGFLGILSFDMKERKFLFCSKSMIDGQYPKMFKDIFYKSKIDEDSEYFSNLANYLINNNVCLVFEVIDHLNDPHIVKYDKDEIVLLDQVKLEQTFSNSSYEELLQVGSQFKFNVKERISIFNDWDELHKFIESIQSYDTSSGIEGFVLEDANKYHFKLKGEWYRFWKMMRGVKDALSKGHAMSTSKLLTPLANDAYGFLKKFSREELANMSIIDVREKFENRIIG